MEHVIVNLYEQNNVNFHISTKSNQLFNVYQSSVNIVKYPKLIKLTFIKPVKVNKLKRKIISTKNLLTKKNTKKFMSRNKLRPAPNLIWGYPLPRLSSLMPIVFVVINVLTAIWLFKHITISWSLLIINELQIRLKIHVLYCHFVSVRNLFTLSFSSCPKVQSFAYLLFYPIVLHSFLIYFACFDNLSLLFAFVNVWLFIELLCIFVLNYLFTI